MITAEAVMNKGFVITPFPEDGFYSFAEEDSAEDTYIRLYHPSPEEIQDAIDKTESEYVIIEYMVFSASIVVSPVTYSKTSPTAGGMFYSVPSNTIGWVV